jgi:probable HAF family extracellular repeat protein
MNERGQTVGRAETTGDQTFHPFLWDGRQLRDLGTLGGNYAEADRINNRGEVTGFSLPESNDTIHTFVWRHGAMTDLSPGDGQCTYPEWINKNGDIAGGTCDGSALLWHNDRQYDLNTLVGPTDVQLTSASYVDDHGRIVALGQRPNGNQHVFLLAPTDA